MSNQYWLNKVNSLTTNDDYSHYQSSATCYQLVLSDFNISSVITERVGRGEVCEWVSPRGWQCMAVTNLQLAVEKPWSMPGGSAFLHKQDYLLSPCRCSISDI